MATQNINIVISSTGGVTVIRNLQQIGQAAYNAITPLKLLERQLSAVMGALAIGEIAKWADEWTSAANKVSVFSKSQEEANTVLDKLFDVAQKVGQPLNSVVDLYHKLSIQAKALGASIEDNIRVTEIVSEALTIQGTSAGQARGALLQLSQSFGTGKVKAQEYNSLLTGLPLILKVVAQHIEGAGGSVAKLTAMQRAGQLSSKDFYDAIQKGGAEIDAIFAKMNHTFGQGMNVLINGLIKFFGQMNESLGISNAFFQLTTFISKNLQDIAKWLTVIAVGVAAAFAPAIVGAFATALVAVLVTLGRLSVLLLANPFAVIAAAVAAVILFGDSWDAGIDKMTTVGDVARALVSILIDGFYEFMVVLSSVWDDFVSTTASVYGFVTQSTDKATAEWTQSFHDFYEDTGTGFWGIVTAVAKTMDAIGGLILGTCIAIGRAFGGLPSVISAVFAAVYNEIAGWMEKAVNVTIDGINKIRSTVGKEMIGAFNIERKDVNKKVFQELGASLGESFNDGFAMQGNYLVENFVKPLEARSRAMGAQRRRDAANRPRPTGLGDRTDPDAVINKAKKGHAAKKDTLPDQLRTLLNRIDPASGAVLEMAKGIGILQQAMDRGLISADQYGKYMVALVQHYKDIIDPLGKYTRDITDQIALDQQLSRERQVEATLLKTKQDLLMKAQPMTDKQIEDMRTLLQLQRDSNEAAAARDQLQAGSKSEESRGFGVKLKAMQDLMKNPDAKFSKQDAQGALQKELPDLFEGTQEAIDLRLQQFQDMYGKIDQMRQADLISAQTAAQMKLKVDAQQTQYQLQGAVDFFSSLEGLQSSSNRKLAAIGKAAAITNATIKGVEAVQNALASVPYPYNIAAAAGMAVQAAANVAKIVSTNSAFATGGQFTVGGSGGVDSKMVAFRASPGEQVSISTPTQVRKGSAGKDGGGGGGASPVVFQPRIVNLVDKNMFADYMNTSEGQQVMVNVIRKNADSVRQAVKNG